jgi:hypothetical protein
MHDLAASLHISFNGCVVANLGASAVPDNNNKLHADIRIK